LAAPVEHRALRQHQDVEPVEGRTEVLDRLRVADVEPGVVETFQVRSLLGRIVGSAAARAIHRDLRAMATEGLRDPVADAAGTADHQHLLTAEIEFVHRALPAFELCPGFWARLLTLSTAWRGGWYGSDQSVVGPRRLLVAALARGRFRLWEHLFCD